MLRMMARTMGSIVLAIRLNACNETCRKLPGACADRRTVLRYEQHFGPVTLAAHDEDGDGCGVPDDLVVTLELDDPHNLAVIDKVFRHVGPEAGFEIGEEGVTLLL